MSQFTYLLGAGASANTISVVNEFEKGLANFITHFSTIGILGYSKNLPDVSLEELKNKVVLDINWLIQECKNHSSVDTFARKLYLTQEISNYNKLKFIVNEFLWFEHYKRGIDKRYDTFFATLLNITPEGLKLPQKIKILSWNYDRQLEYSFSQFSNFKNDEIQEHLNISPRKNNETGYIHDEFQLFKLNGSFGSSFNENGDFEECKLPDFKEIKTKGNPFFIRELLIDLLIKYYINEESGYQKGISTIMYSWEKNPLFNQVRTNALSATKDTEYLVIIGYSFPTFNRNLDKDLLQNMNNLKKVFIQSMPESIEGVIQRFISIIEPSKQFIIKSNPLKSILSISKETIKHENTIEIIPMTDVNEFYIPFEF